MSLIFCQAVLLCWFPPPPPLVLMHCLAGRVNRWDLDPSCPADTGKCAQSLEVSDVNGNFIILLRLTRFCIVRFSGFQNILFRSCTHGHHICTQLTERHGRIVNLRYETSLLEARLYFFSLMKLSKPKLQDQLCRGL